MEEVTDRNVYPGPIEGYNPYDEYDNRMPDEIPKPTPKYTEETMPWVKDAIAKRQAELQATAPEADSNADKSDTAPANVVAIARRAHQVSAETVSLLEQLLEDARAGVVTGLAVVVLQSKGNYDLRLRGNAAESGNQMSVAGMLAALQRMVLDLAD